MNLEGAVNCARYFLPLVRASQAKRIVYISSGAGSTGLGLYVCAGARCMLTWTDVVRTAVADPRIHPPPRSTAAAPRSSIARPGDVASYGVSRAAANHYFARLARQLEGEGVRVTIYSPCVASQLHRLTGEGGGTHRS